MSSTSSTRILPFLIGGHRHAALENLALRQQLLRQADYVAVTLSLNEQTRGLVRERELSLMKPSAVLVNVARAEIIDEDALYRALRERRIAGAALDVWYRYPKERGAMFPAPRPFH